MKDWAWIKKQNRRTRQLKSKAARKDCCGCGLCLDGYRHNGFEGGYIARVPCPVALENRPDLFPHVQLNTGPTVQP